MKQSTVKLLNDTFETEKDDVRKLLDEELDKPEHKRDYARINELVSTHISLMGIEESAEERTTAGMVKLQERLHEEKPRIRPTKRFRLLMTAGIAAVMLLAANAISVAAYQQDVFSVIVHYVDHNFFIEYPNDKILNLPTTPDDPYGIRTECAKYGLDVLAPMYLPEGFVLGDCECHQLDAYTAVDFRFYRNKREVIGFTYTCFADPDAYSSIPSDDMNLREVDVHGTPAIVSEEDGQYTIIFKKGTLETIITSDCGYSECDKIIASLE